jgi:hypothetical protein
VATTGGSTGAETDIVEERAITLGFWTSRTIAFSYGRARRSRNAGGDRAAVNEGLRRGHETPRSLPPKDAKEYGDNLAAVLKKKAALRVNKQNAKGIQALQENVLSPFSLAGLDRVVPLFAVC